MSKTVEQYSRTVTLDVTYEELLSEYMSTPHAKLFDAMMSAAGTTVLHVMQECLGSHKPPHSLSEPTKDTQSRL